MTFPQNKKVLKLCIKDYIYRSCYFFVEVTFQYNMLIHLSTGLDTLVIYFTLYCRRDTLVIYFTLYCRR